MAVFLFDLDGTLLDSSNFLLKKMHHAFDTVNKPYPGDQKIFTDFGRPLTYFIKKYNIESSDKFTQAFHVNPEGSCPKLFEFVDKLIEELGDSKFAIITSKDKKGIDDLNRELNLSSIFPIIITAEDVINPKPAAEGIKKALELLGEDQNQQIIYVGDTIVDMLTAMSAGVLGVGVGWSLQSYELKSFCNTHYLTFVENGEELIELIKRVKNL